MNNKNYLILILISYIFYLKIPDIQKFILLNFINFDFIKEKKESKLFDNFSKLMTNKISENLSNNIKDSKMLEMCKYSLIGGKKLRPLIFLSVYNSILNINLLEETPNYIFDMSLVIEYLHCASLILDDIMDNDFIRRDKLANFIKFGQSNSLLCSIIICNLAISNMLSSVSKLSELPKCNKNISYIIINFLNKMINDLTMGQYFDVVNKNINIQELINKKTSSLFEFCFVIPWLCANNNLNIIQLNEGIEQMKYLGKLFGNIFQIADDFEDYLNDKMKKINNVNIILKYGKEKTLKYYNNNVESFYKYSKEYKVSNKILEEIIEQINIKVNKYYDYV